MVSTIIEVRNKYINIEVQFSLGNPKLLLKTE